MLKGRIPTIRTDLLNIYWAAITMTLHWSHLAFREKKFKNLKKQETSDHVNEAPRKAFKIKSEFSNSGKELLPSAFVNKFFNSLGS